MSALLPCVSYHLGPLSCRCVFFHSQQSKFRRGFCYRGHSFHSASATARWYRWLPRSRVSGFFFFFFFCSLFYLFICYFVYSFLYCCLFICYYLMLLLCWASTCIKMSRRHFLWTRASIMHPREARGPTRAALHWSLSHQRNKVTLHFSLSLFHRRT